MKKIFKQILTFVLTAGVFVSLTACGTASSKGTDSSGGEKELTKVRIGIDTQQLAYYQIIAKEEGFFEEEGIDAELISYAAGIETLNALVLKEIDIGAAYDYAACTRLTEDTNLRMVSGYVTNVEGTNWFETTVPGAKTAADLKGKKIGVLQGTLGEYLWAKELESVGLTSKDVEMNYLSSAQEVVTAYVQGSVDAILGESNFLEQTEKAEGRTVLNTPNAIGIESQGYIFADADFAASNQDALEGYYRALNKALDYFQKNQDDAAQEVADYMTASKSDILSAAALYKYDIRFSKEDYEHLQDIADWTRDNEVTGEIHVADFVVIDALKEAYPDKVTYDGGK